MVLFRTRSFFSKRVSFILLALLIPLTTHWSTQAQSAPTIPQPAMIHDLYYPLPYFSQQAARWALETNNGSIDVISSSCNSETLLGGPGVFTTVNPSMKVNYTNLRPHNSVFLSVEITFIDAWPTQDIFGIRIGDMVSELNMSSTDSSLWPGNACGDSNKKDLTSTILTVQSPSSSKDLTITFYKRNSTTTNQFGIRDLRISLSNQTVESVTSFPYQSYCIASPSQAFSEPQECPCPVKRYETGKTSGICASCHSSCQTCYGPLETQCLTCETGYSYDGNSCVLCDGSCDSCYGSSPDQCYRCPIGKYLYPDSTCQDNCEPQYRNGSAWNLTCNNIQCTAANTLNFAEVSSEQLYYYPDDQACRNVCPKPYVIKSGSTITFCELLLSEEEKKQIRALSAAANAVGNVMTAGVVAVTATTPSDSNIMNVGSLSILFEYSRFFDVSRSAKLEAYYKSHTPKSAAIIFTNGFSNNTIEEFPSRPLPLIFGRLNSNFLVNIFANIESLVTWFTVTLFIYCIELFIRKYLSKFSQYFRLAKIALLSFAMMQYYSLYAEIMFYGTLEFRTFRGGNALSWISFFTAILFYAITLVVLFLHFRLLRQYQSFKAKSSTEEGARKFQEFLKNHDKIENLYKDYKDISVISQAYLIFLTTRSSLIATIMGVLFAHPIAEAILNICFGITMLIYLFAYFPFRVIFSDFQQIVYELILLIVNICYLVLAIFDVSTGDFEESRNNIGNLIIAMIFSAKFVPMLTIIPKAIEGIKMVRKMLNERKQASKQAKAELTSERETPINLEAVTLRLPENTSPNAFDDKDDAKLIQANEKTRKLTRDASVTSKSELPYDKELEDGESRSPIMHVSVRTDLRKLSENPFYFGDEKELEETEAISAVKQLNVRDNLRKLPKHQ